MKTKLFLLFALLVGFTACEEKQNPMHVTYIDDMMYFTVWPKEYELVTPWTNMDAVANSSVELNIYRNAFVAIEYPRQTARIEVDEAESTAILGEDFELSATKFDFNNEDDFRKPFTIDIGDAAGKKIVLRLVYDEYPSCPLSGRKSNCIEISVQ